MSPNRAAKKARPKVKIICATKQSKTGTSVLFLWLAPMAVLALCLLPVAQHTAAASCTAGCAASSSAW